MHSQEKQISKYTGTHLIKSHSPLTHADKLMWITELLTGLICGYYKDIQQLLLPINTDKTFWAEELELKSSVCQHVSSPAASKQQIPCVISSQYAHHLPSWWVIWCMVIKCDLISFDINPNILNVKKYIREMEIQMASRKGNSHIITSDLRNHAKYSQDVWGPVCCTQEDILIWFSGESLEIICKRGL